MKNILDKVLHKPQFPRNAHETEKPYANPGAQAEPRGKHAQPQKAKFIANPKIQHPSGDAITNFGFLDSWVFGVFD